MDAPPVQYVKTSDGYDIAYAVSGSGLPFVVAGTGVEHVQLEWHHPGFKDWLPELAARFRLVQLDHRGSGMSTRGLPDDFAMDDCVRDLEAVVDHLRLDRFVLYGALMPPGPMAVQYAVTHPERVVAVILSAMASDFAAYRAPALFQQGLMAQDWDLFVHSLVAVAAGPAPFEERQRAEEIFKQAFDQRDLLIGARTRIPFVTLLERLIVPTLVIDQRDFAILPREEPLKVARLAKAKLVTIDGWNPPGNVDQCIHAIEAFMADLPPHEATVEPPGGLSDRELEVLRLIVQGKSNPEIANELFITRNTVQNHVSSILIKLNLQNRAQAAVYAQQHGIV